ncbi:MAG: BatA domain-containing protein, partial [Bartonella sp.]|nr:BatA domain-containing protein [Bartonella sp.]
KQTNQQETTNHTPWWLLLLRLTIAALIIIALARPTWIQKPIVFSGSHPLALIIDNGWASAEEWKKRIAVAKSLITQAEKQQKNIYLLATAENNTHDIGPFPAEVIKQHLLHLHARPWPVNRVQSLQKFIEQIGEQPLDIAYLSDGLQTNEDNQAFTLIKQLKLKTFLWYANDVFNITGITNIENNNGNMAARVIRTTSYGETPITLSLYDFKNQLLARFTTNFHEGETTAFVPFDLPLELRNHIAWIKIDNQAQAAATFLIDNRSRINRVALLSPNINEMVQPLLSPMYYVIKALQGHAQLIITGGGELSSDIDRLLNQNPSVFIMGDIVNISKEAEKKLSHFVNKGGILIRFAGENLSTTKHYDSLLPVSLRSGERLLGSIMSWTKP